MPVSLARHDELLHQAVGAAGGRVFKHTGDGICAAFSTAPAALAAALAAAGPDGPPQRGGRDPWW
jgi:class 3 adenylate cyclase